MQKKEKIIYLTMIEMIGYVIEISNSTQLFINFKSNRGVLYAMSLRKTESRTMQNISLCVCFRCFTHPFEVYLIEFFYQYA